MSKRSQCIHEDVDATPIDLTASKSSRHQVTFIQSMAEVWHSFVCMIAGNEVNCMKHCTLTVFLSYVSAVALVLSAGAGRTALSQSSPIVPTGWESHTSTSLQAAGRILNQASFGPTISDVFLVENLGVKGYIDEQLAQKPYQIPLANPAPVVDGDCGSFACTTEYYWWNDVLFGPDQLRQRVAFELSKLFVVSIIGVDGRYLPNYLNILSRDAFGNWLNLMQDVTLSPAMGTYLNMANSTAPTSKQSANENYARELMQLFSLGTNALNQDGTEKSDSNGQAVPNYTQAQVQDFALAYTGWTFANADCSTPGIPLGYWYGGPPGQNCPMVPLPWLHSTVQKNLLRGVVLPAGQSPQDDLKAALSNIFNDPSLPPFVCRRLIQALVLSNPSAEYISRVSQVFIDNGAGVRGDMPSILRAILLDPEARAGDTLSFEDPNGGKLRDPILWWSSVMRAVGATSNAQLPNVGIYNERFNVWMANLDEVPHAAPSVFSYYSPDYKPSIGGLFGPEFQNENTNTVPWMALHLQDALKNDYNASGVQASEFNTNLGPGNLWYTFATQTGALGLTNVLDALLMHGTMTSNMQQAIVQAVKDTDPATMVRNTIYLIATSPQYRVIF